MKKTKIVCTMGPNTDNREIMKELALNGMDVARFNFSHGDHAEHKHRLEILESVREELGIPIASLLDTKGPEIRTGKLKDGKKVTLKEGDLYTLTTEEIVGDETRGYINYAGLAEDVKPGDRILIDDGLIELHVREVNGTDIVCRIENGGELGEKKGVNVPGVRVKLPALTDKDKEDIRFGVDAGFDFVAASFVRNADAIREIREILDEKGSAMQIIAKIENEEGIENIDSIIEASDGIMVARGDLGVEVPFEELPEIQKSIIKTCISRGKRVVTATQMLESMAKNPRPTRAEVSDVANAVYDGTSAIMLSGETSVGKYPVETVRTMSRIAENAEKTIHYDRRRVTRLEFQNMNVDGDMKTLAISHATCSTSADLGVKGIVAFTESGSTARAVSTYRPGAPIIAATPSEKTFNRLTMSWGVKPILVEKRPQSGTELYHLSEKAAVTALDLRVGDVITITAGMPVGEVYYTNTLRVHELTEKSFED